MFRFILFLLLTVMLANGCKTGSVQHPVNNDDECPMGHVLLRVSIDENGNVTDAKVIDSDPKYKYDKMFVREMMKTTWRQPLNDDGQPTSTEIVYRYCIKS